MPRMVLPTLLCLILALPPTASAAGAGDLDPAFSGDGIAITPVHTLERYQYDEAMDVLVQPDGKVVLVGNRDLDVRASDDWMDPGAVRHLPDGTLDPSFGTGGIARPAVPDWTWIEDGALQADGKVLMAGVGLDHGLVMRLTASGAADGGFGAGGVVLVEQLEYVSSVAALPDGRILAAGYTTSAATGNRAAVVRLTATGEVDESFGTDGLATLEFSDNGTRADGASDMVVESSGVIALLGSTERPDRRYSIGIARLSADGRELLGRRSLHISAFPSDNSDTPGGLALAPDGKLVAAWQFNGGGTRGRDIAVARFDAALDRDSAYGELGDGIARIDSGLDDRLSGVAVQPDGKAVVAGSVPHDASPSYHTDFQLARLRTTGLLDPTFAGTGIRKYDLQGESSDTPNGVAVDPRDGSIYAAGWSRAKDAQQGDFTVARVTGAHPALAAITAGPTGTVASKDASFAFEALTEQQGTFECRLLELAAWEPCVSPKTYRGLPDGAHRFEVRFIPRNAEGEEHPATERRWTSDTVAPSATITGGPSGEGNPDSAAFTFDAGEDGATYRCQVDQRAPVACNSPFRVFDLDAGDHSFRVWAADAAGNEQAVPAQRLWTVGDGDGGPVIVPPPPATVSCPEGTLPSVTVGPAVAVALADAACLRPRAVGKDTYFTSPGPLKVNGIVLRPDAGAGLELRREAGDGRMRFTGPVTFELGRASFRVPTGFSWRLGKANSIAKLAIPAWEELQKGHLKPSIGGLPIGVSPQFELTASDNGGQAKIGVKLELPGMFRTLPSGGEDLFDDGATGGLTLEAVVTASNDNGVSYNVKSKLKKAWFFGLELEDVGFGLDSGPPYTFEGFAKLMLTRERELSLALSLGEGGLLGSSLRKASIQAAKFAVPLGHGVFLQRFGGDMEIGKDPAGNVAPVWSANAGLSFGPRIDLKPFFDGEAVSLDGKIKYTAGAPWVIEASGDAKVVELPLAGASVKYTAGGRWDVAGRIDLTIGGYGVYGEVKDAWATDKGFSVEASGDLRLPGGIATRSETVASTVGFATCQGPANARVGLGQRWGRPAEKMIGVCDVGPYRLAAPSARAAQAPDTPPAFVEIPRGARLFAVELHGRTAPPKPALVGPRGASVATLEGPEPLVSRDATVVQDPVTATTTIVLRDPAPGRWYVVREFGGEPLTHVRTASGRPPVAASAVVRGRGGRRELRWRLRPQPGQKVTFVERGRSGERVLVTTNRRRGALRFRPGTGRRTIEALVTQDGLPRAQRVLARFTGPLAKLRRVARLRLRGRTVLWAGQPAAARYAVALRPRGGTATAHTTRRARFALKKRCRGKLRVSVVALGPDGRVGPRASKTLRCSR